MILCITPNPAIDRTLILPNLTPGDVHRAGQVIVAAGGKGLNVARAIETLGGRSLCMGFLGGHTGHLFVDLAQDVGLAGSWTWTDSETRTCTILVAQNGDGTVINETGVPVPSSAWKRLKRDVRRNISATSLVCVCGSLPHHSSPEDWYGLLKLLVVSKKQVWVDTSGRALDAALALPGICIKVNKTEIGEALGFEVKNLASAKRALNMIRDRGVSACLITLGAAGALLATPDGNWYVRGPRVRVVSTVGSGDSLLGGFVSALDQGREWSAALRDGVAAGTANALSAGGGRFTLREFEKIRKQVIVQPW
ncbi:MAG TPA: 1-phosphofructokinase family hexose kinase [Anaerolineales bacterium]|nr:1-phosphofructokinase family hexose kinase [Anaerolineales bacterium]